MYRMFLIGLLAGVVNLASCGGDAGLNEQDVSDLSGPIYDQYTGSTTRASLTNNQLQQFIPLVFSGPYGLPSSLSSQNISVANSRLSMGRLSDANLVTGAVVGSNECPFGGEERVSGAINSDRNGRVEISYINCNMGFAIMHGLVTVDFINDDTGGFKTVLYYKKILTTDSSGQYRLSGRLRINETADPDSSKLIADIVMVDMNSPVHIKMENYVFNRCNQSTCWDYSQHMEGRIYHSNFGFVDVYTEKNLITGGYLQRDVIASGQVTLTGRSGASVALIFDEFDVYRRNTLNLKQAILRVSRDQDGDGEYEFVHEFPSILAFEDEIYDFDDDDGDGILNGWEKLYGLDPKDDIDAALDTDGDGFSNILEFSYFGDPANAEDVPRVVDMSVNLQAPSEVLRAGQTQEFIVDVVNPNPTYGTSDVVVIITKSENLQWGEEWYCVRVELDPNRVACKIGVMPSDTIRPVIFSVIGEVEQYNVDVSVSAGVYDDNPTNNSDTYSSAFNQRQVDLQLLPDFEYSENPYYDVAVIDAPHVFDIHFYKVGGDVSYNTVLRMTLPDRVQVTSAEYMVVNESVGQCSITTDIVCELGEISASQADGSSGYVRVGVTGETEGYGDYTVTLESDAVDYDVSNNTFTTDVFVGHSVQPYQNLIDNSTGPVTVDIGPGMYVGALDFSGKQVTLNGSSGVNATQIRPDSPIQGLAKEFYVDSDSVIRNIHFNMRRYGIRRINAITINGAKALIEGNVFENNWHGASGIEVVGLNVDVVLRGNLFHASQEDHSCASMLFKGIGDYRIENNLIYDTSCSGIVFISYFPDPSNRTTHIVTNNTIVNNRNPALSEAVAISEVVVLDGSTSKIQNNIIVNNDQGINVSFHGNGYPIQYPYAAPEVIDNLFYENTKDVYAHPVIDTTLYSSGGNLYQDPLFLDADNNDFHLSGVSPAIDSGTNLDAPLFDIESNIRPIDGNGDLLYKTDIGAYEYHP